MSLHDYIISQEKKVTARNDRLIRLLLTKHCSLIIPFSGVKVKKIAFEARDGQILRFVGTGTYNLDEGESMSLQAIREEFEEAGSLIYKEGVIRYEEDASVVNFLKKGGD